MSEAFVYLWYDSENKMFYLGKHKGTPEDRYTHSSTIWESFTKDNIPKGTKRRILTFGTHEEMCVLEHNMLKNRKSRCWDRYYNESLGDPRYVDMSGKNNPMYKHGLSVGRYSSDPELIAQFKEWDKIRKAKYHKKHKERIAALKREYYKNNKDKRAEYCENNKEKIAEQRKQYRKNNKEKIDAWKKEWRKNNKEKISALNKKYREKVKMQKSYQETR